MPPCTALQTVPAPALRALEMQRNAPPCTASRAHACDRSMCMQVVAAERDLRSALLKAGLRPQESYVLARYNDPFTPPFLRRNEVLIGLTDFQLPKLPGAL